MKMVLDAEGRLNPLEKQRLNSISLKLFETTGLSERESLDKMELLSYIKNAKIKMRELINKKTLTIKKRIL